MRRSLDKIVYSIISFMKELLHFLGDQILRLFLVRPCNATEKARQRSHWVGFFSLLLLLFPLGFLYGFIEEASMVDYLIYTSIGFSSLAGDYFFVNTTMYPTLSRHVAFIDNWVALIAVGFNLSKLIHYTETFDWRVGVCLILASLALPLLHISRHIVSQQHWVFIHTTWHLLATSISITILEVQRFASLNI